ncbi:MAG: hypothetical protein ACHQUC_00135 [Chlamydiales bacterium]
MTSNQSISQSFFGPIMQFAKQDSTIKFVLKINDLVKKVSRVALIVFFAMHCLINCIHNPGTSISFAYGIVATLILGTTYIISGVKSVFEDIERQEKEDDAKESKKEAKRLADLEAERLAIAQRAAQKENEVADRQRLAEEAQRLAEQKAEEARRLAEQKEQEVQEVAKRMAEEQDRANQEIDRIQAEMKSETDRLQKRYEETELAREEAVKKSEEDKKQAEREMEAEKERNRQTLETQRSEMEERRGRLQTQYDNALNSGVGLQGRIDQLVALQENAMGELDQANADKLEMQGVQQVLEAEKNRLAKELERTTQAKDVETRTREDLQLTVGTITQQRENYSARLQKKIQKLTTARNEIRQLRVDSESLTRELTKSNEDNRVMRRVLRGLFVECLCGETPKDFVKVIKEVEDLNKPISVSMRRTLQKYNEIFYTFLDGLSKHGIDLELGELELALKKEFGGKSSSTSNTDTLLDRFRGWLSRDKKTPKDQEKGEPHQPKASKDSNPQREPPPPASASTLSSSSDHSPISNSPKAPMFCGSLLDGAEINFQKEKITEGDNCGFSALRINRQDVKGTLIVLSGRKDIRDRLCDEVFEAFITNAIEQRFSSSTPKRIWNVKQGLLDKTLSSVRDNNETMPPFSAEPDGEAVYHKSIQWLQENRRPSGAQLLEKAFLEREQATWDLKSYCKNVEAYHLYCDAYLNKLRLRCESAIIFAEQRKFPLYIWEQLPTSSHLSLRKSYSPPNNLDQSQAVHLLYSMGNHFDRLVVVPPAPSVDEVISAPPQSSSSSFTSPTSSDETAASLAENQLRASQAHTAEKSSQNREEDCTAPDSGVGGTATERSAVSGSGSAEVPQDQSDDAQTIPAVLPVAELQGSTAVTTSNKISESDSFDEDDPNKEDSASESSRLISSSSSNDGKSQQTKPKEKSSWKFW